MRIAEAFCKMRLSDYCSSQDIDRAIAVTVDSFVASQKVSCKKALARTFSKYVSTSYSFTFWNSLSVILTICPYLGIHFVSEISRKLQGKRTMHRRAQGAAGRETGVRPVPDRNEKDIPLTLHDICFTGLWLFMITYGIFHHSLGLVV